METAPRGGEVTFHGPGQLVAYPIVNIRQLGVGARAWVEGLERSVVSTAALHGVRARVRCPTSHPKASAPASHPCSPRPVHRCRHTCVVQLWGRSPVRAAGAGAGQDRRVGRGAQAGGAGREDIAWNKVQCSCPLRSTVPPVTLMGSR